tara:strand:+ start:73 stop:717 length:645 start_codon:yes stop_codon:yes gene_type:complete
MPQVDIDGLNSTLKADVIRGQASTSTKLGGDLDLDGNDITGTGGIPAANLTGTLPAINGSSLTGLDSGNKAVYIQVQATVADKETANLPFHATQLNDGIDVIFTGGWTVPSNFTSIVSLHCWIFAVGTGNLYMNFRCDQVASGETNGTDSDTIAATTYPITANNNTSYDITASINGLTLNTGDLVGIQGTRNATHASDTVNDTAKAQGFVLVYA